MKNNTKNKLLIFSTATMLFFSQQAYSKLIEVSQLESDSHKTSIEGLTTIDEVRNTQGNLSDGKKTNEAMFALGLAFSLIDKINLYDTQIKHYKNTGTEEAALFISITKTNKKHKECVYKNLNNNALMLDLISAIIEDKNLPGNTPLLPVVYSRISTECIRQTGMLKTFDALIKKNGLD